MRDYQLEGLNWLMFCWIRRQGSIIADEMGLGKTVQSVSFLEQIRGFNIRGPFLVIAPLSTIPHWYREFKAWTDMNVIIYHGNTAARDMIYEHEFFYKDKRGNPIPNLYKFDVIITTYEMIIAGQEHLKPIYWRVNVVDEAHRLKNKSSKLAEILSTYQLEHRVLATGTPLQNRLEELFALLHFLEPERFPDEEEFLAEFGDLKKSEDVNKLQALLRPFMLRRLKEDVEKTIPVKEETIVEVELTPPQKKYYRAILERNFGFLVNNKKRGNAPNLINTMMELRKCCIHPYLIQGAEDRIIAESNAVTEEEQWQLMINASGKLVLLDKLLNRLKQNGHKVLIFSQMTKCLDILQDYLRYREYQYERIDGNVRGDSRQAAIDRFCDLGSKSFVFLLCTRAGGVGINLTAADTVIIYDSDWNPQNDLQAQARCHRIGQKKAVKVYRLITRNSYEREMFDKAGMKLGLDKAILQRMGGSNSTVDLMDTDSASTTADTPSTPGLTRASGSIFGSTASNNPSKLSKEEVEALLKKGAYGLLMENDEER